MAGHAHACLHPAHPRPADAARHAVTAQRDRGTAQGAGAGPLLKLTDVSKQFEVRSRRPFQHGKAVQAVSGVSLTVAAGETVAVGLTEEVYGAPRHPYTAGLIQSIPLPDPARERAKTTAGLGGELPSAIDPPSGCRFRTRCPLATGRCAQETPRLSASAGLHAVACHYPLTSSSLAQTG